MPTDPTLHAGEPRARTPYAFERRDRCPACGEEVHETIYSSAFSEGSVAVFVREYYHADPEWLREAPYELLRCGNCSLVFQHYVGGPELLSDLYTHWVEEPEDPEADIATYREEIRNVPLSRDAHEIMAAASYLRLPLTSLKTLDYGMGWALWARIAAQLGCDSYGSDLAIPRMEFAERHGVRTVEDTEIGRHRFHFINTEQVFEHVPEPLELLRKLAGALEPGGIVKISVPSGDNVEGLLADLNEGRYRGDYQTIIPVQPLEHVNCFTRRSVADMAAKAGMEIARPGLFHGFAFLRHRGTLRLTRPKKALKELIRPWYQYRNPSNIYVWLRKRA